MQRIGLDTVVDTPRKWKLKFKRIERAAGVSLEREARVKIEQACEYFHYLSQQPRRDEIKKDLGFLAHKVALAKRSRKNRDLLVLALDSIKVPLFLLLAENGIDTDRLAEEFARGTGSVVSFLTKLRNIKAKFSSSRRGRERNWEFENLVRVLVEEYWKAGGKRRGVTHSVDTRYGPADIEDSPQWSGVIVDLVSEVVKQLKPRIHGVYSNLLPANIGRAVEAALSRWYTLSDADPAGLELWREHKPV